MVSTQIQTGINFGRGMPVKATIWNEETNKEVVTCMFNPTAYTIERTNTWQADSSKRDDVPQVNFGGTAPMTLTVNELLFDTLLRRRDDADPEDVSDYTRPLFELMKINSSSADSSNGTAGRPPKVSFRCGQMFTFKAVITKVTQKFVLFWTDGRPVRAMVDISFLQAEAVGVKPPQNPTSYALAHKVRLVAPNETLDSIAYQEYGDASRWRLLAAHNRLENPMRLRAGQRLVIPLETSGSG